MQYYNSYWAIKRQKGWKDVTNDSQKKHTSIKTKSLNITKQFNDDAYGICSTFMDQTQTFTFSMIENMQTCNHNYNSDWKKNELVQVKAKAHQILHLVNFVEALSVYKRMKQKQKQKGTHTHGHTDIDTDRHVWRQAGRYTHTHGHTDIDTDRHV